MLSLEKVLDDKIAKLKSIKDALNLDDFDTIIKALIALDDGSQDIIEIIEQLPVSAVDRVNLRDELLLYRSDRLSYLTDKAHEVGLTKQYLYQEAYHIQEFKKIDPEDRMKKLPTYNFGQSRGTIVFNDAFTHWDRKLTKRHRNQRK